METGWNLFGHDADERVLFDAFLAELHATLGLGKQGVIGANADVLGRRVIVLQTRASTRRLNEAELPSAVRRPAQNLDHGGSAL